MSDGASLVHRRALFPKVLSWVKRMVTIDFSDVSGQAVISSASWYQCLQCNIARSAITAWERRENHYSKLLLQFWSQQIFFEGGWNWNFGMRWLQRQLISPLKNNCLVNMTSYLAATLGLGRWTFCRILILSTYDLTVEQVGLHQMQAQH